MHVLNRDPYFSVVSCIFHSPCLFSMNFKINYSQNFFFYRPQYHCYFCFRFMRVFCFWAWLTRSNISQSGSKRNENKCEYGSILSIHFLLVPIFCSSFPLSKRRDIYILVGCLTAFKLTHVTAKSFLDENRIFIVSSSSYSLSVCLCSFTKCVWTRKK